jgi:hypothetical protein
MTAQMKKKPEVLPLVTLSKASTGHHLFIIEELLLELLQSFILRVVTRGELQYYATAKKICTLHILVNI